MPFLLSQLIEACRWLGALAVLALHTTNIFVNLGDIMSGPHAAPAYLWWFFTAQQCGHQAVVGFFVISGYLVGGAVLENLRKPPARLREYYIHRICRIYMVLAPALLLTAVFDLSGRWLFANSGVYAWPIFEGHFTSGLFLATLANLQGVLFEYFGTNGPMWSLACEFWYYILFPLLTMTFAVQRSAGARLLLFALGATLSVLFVRQPGWFGFGFILWGMGALATRAPRPLIRSRGVALSLYAGALAMIRLLVRGELLATHPWIGDGADLLSATLFIVVLLAFRDGGADGYGLLRLHFHKKLADFSFSLYAIHMPLLIFARAGAGQLMGETWVTQLAQPSNYLLALLIMAAILLIAWGFSRSTEARTGEARKLLRAALDRIAPSLASVAD